MPGGGLTESEARELNELEARARVPGALPDAVPESVASTDPAPNEAAQADPAASTDPAAPAEPSARVAEAPRESSDRLVPSATRRRRWLLPLVAAIAVLVGFGGGWLASAQGDGAPAMSDEQQEAWTRIEASGTYDPGSLQLVGEQYGVSVWQATKNGSTADCLILTRGEAEKAGCMLPEESDDAYYYQPQATLQYTDGAEEYMLWATYVDDVTGERRVVVQRQSSSEVWDWRSQYDDRELAMAERIADAGFAGEFLQIVGYDGDIPVWLFEGDRTCLLVEQEQGLAEQCGMLLYDSEPTLELDVPGATYSVHASSSRGYDLTIVRHAESGTSAAR